MPPMLSSKEITLDFFNDKPRSIAKDFYIWRFLDQNITAKEAEALIGEVYNMSSKLFFKFADKLDKEGFKQIAECLKASPKELINSSDDCIAVGLTPKKAVKLSKDELLKAAEKVEEKYPQRAEIFKILASNNVFEELTKADPEIFFKVFNSVDPSYIYEKLNYEIPKNILTKLSQYYAFNQSVKIITINENLKNLQKSILDLNSSKLSANGNLYLAFNAIKHNEKEKAVKYLQIAHEKAFKRFEKDRSLFWLYKVTNDKKYLVKLANSPKVNFYSIYAMELLHKKVKNIVTNLSHMKERANFPVNDPFAWQDLKNKAKKADENELRKMADNLNAKNTEPFAAYLYEKAGKFKKEYFLMPYYDSIKNLTPKRKAMLLAIARQESKFIPTDISSSYALGMMQFMPFVAKDLAKKMGYEDFDLDNLFQPEIAYKFANYYLDYLEQNLNHPLFIFYAYNAGIGFLTRFLKKSNLFTQKNIYEPYLSMELFPNDQARYYGKKVLANYIIYSQLLGKKTMLTPLLRKLENPFQKAYSRTRE